MRIQRGVPVAGIDPAFARDLARACHDRWSTSAQIAWRLRREADEVETLLHQLVEGGFLQTRSISEPSDIWEWNTTLAGGALTMASFLKPIKRAKADMSLAGVLERAAAYNADDTKPYIIATIVVFGSYLRPDVDTLGDLDLAITTAPRSPESDSADSLLAYADASDRRFNTFIDQLAWGQVELKQVLRARSGYINVHTEDISRFTQDSRIVFDARRGDQSGAASASNSEDPTP